MYRKVADQNILDDVRKRLTKMGETTPLANWMTAVMASWGENPSWYRHHESEPMLASIERLLREAGVDMSIPNSPYTFIGAVSDESQPMPASGPLRTSASLEMSGDTWLAEIGIVNETTSVASAGNVTIFRSAADACLFFDQYCGSGFVLSVEGDRLEIKDGINEDIEVRRVPYPDGKKIARAWLEARAAKILAERKRAARRGNVVLNAVEGRDEIPRSTLGLIAYIGFSG